MRFYRGRRRANARGEAATRKTWVLTCVLTWVLKAPAVANAFVEDFDVGDALRVGNDRGEEGDVADLGGGRFAGAEAAWARTHKNSRISSLHPEDGRTSLAGGGYLTMIAYEGKGVKPLMKEGKDDAVMQGHSMVKIDLAKDSPDGPRVCEYAHYDSIKYKLKCEPEPVDRCLDGLSLNDLKSLGPSDTESCPTRPKWEARVNDEVLEVSKLAKLRGGKSNTNVGVATMQSTPVVFSISPKVVSPGEIITVFGRTCMGDIWKVDDSGESKREEGLENFDKTLDFFPDVRKRIGLRDDLIRAFIGPFPCEVRDPKTERYYRSEITTSIGWKDRKHGFCGEIDGWFQCRIPDAVPEGRYNVRFETKSRGHSISPLEAEYGWHLNASEGYNVQVVRGHPARVHKITALKTTSDGRRWLSIRGTNMKKKGLSVQYGRVDCDVHAVHQGDLTASCPASGSHSTSTSNSEKGSVAWLRERWVFKEGSKYITAHGWKRPLGLKDSHPMPSLIMDKLSAIARGDASYTEGFDATRVVNLIPNAQVYHPFDGSHPALLGHRRSVFERVSGIITAQHSGAVRILMWHFCSGGKAMAVRVRPLNNASVNDHLVPWDVDMAFDKKDNGVHTQWLNVTKDEEYYVEFLLRFDAGWRSKWNRGGFKALFEFTYHVNDFAGDTGVLPISPTRHATSAHAHALGDYVLRTGATPEDTIVIEHNRSTISPYGLKLWEKGPTIKLDGIAQNAQGREIEREIRASLKWATCEDLPEGSTIFDPENYHPIHPYDVAGRWITLPNTPTFKGFKTKEADEYRTLAALGGADGAAIDYSTSYCSSHSQRFNLSLLPNGRVVSPMKDFRRSSDAKFLNFAYKLSPGSRATMLLRLEYAAGKHRRWTIWKYQTCAILLTHEQATLNRTDFDHPACIDLRSEIQRDGQWHFVSLNWRTALAGGPRGIKIGDKAMFPEKIEVRLAGLGVGAQRYLGRCPEKQAMADAYAGQEHSELRGELWLDAVSISTQKYVPRRTKVSAAQLGGMIEGQQAITGIEYAVRPRGDATSASCVHKYANCDAVIKLRRITQCVGQSQRSTVAALSPSTFVLTDEVSQGGSILPHVYVKSGGGPSANNILTLRAGGSFTSIPEDARPETIAQALNGLIGVDASGIQVIPLFDSFDVCGVRARRVRLSHASDLEVLQARHFARAGSVSSEQNALASRDASGTSNSHEFGVSVRAQDNTSIMGSTSELIARHETSKSMYRITLGSTAEEVRVHVPMQDDDQLRTVILRDNGVVLPCAPPPDSVNSSNFDWWGRYLGDASCALPATEQLVHEQLGLAESGDETESADLGDSLDQPAVNPMSVAFPGHDTWAKKKLHLGPNEIEEFSVAVPGNRDALLGQYEAVVGHARRLLRAGGSLNNTRSKYELPARAGKFSDPSVWGSHGVPNMNTTDMVVIPAGFNLTLDVSDTYFRVWIIEGRLDFADVDITMEAEMIIVNGDDAHFTIGNATHPYRRRAEIILHGHWRSLGLPKYGVKCIALTSGRLTFYGKPVNPWMELAATVTPGATSITVQDRHGGTLDLRGWDVGSKIVVTSTSYGDGSCRLDRQDRCQPEEREIQTIDTLGDGSSATITFGEPLRYKHWGESTPVAGSPNGKTVERRAEVMLLTRNINVRGTTEYNGQDLVGFGAHTMMMSGQMLLKFVEFGPNVGQAFQLGRYAVHYHTPNEKMFKYGLKASKDPKMQGADQRLSGVEGCSIHHSNNRGVAVHGCFHLPLVNNVVYNVMGHAMFVEDGIEMFNVFKENVVSLVHSAFSLLNGDQTPAAFWISNANNRFIGNRASSSHTHGYWFDPPIEGRPTGPSADTRGGPLGVRDFNPMLVPLLQFENNTAHSNGAAGLWIHGIKHTSHGMYQKMILKNTLSWNNGGFGFSVLPGVGHVQIISGIAMGNSIDIAYTKEIYAQSWATGDSNWNGNLVLNTTLRGDPDRATQAIGGPHGAWITFRDVLISSYTSKRPPIAHCRICPSWKGGMEVRFAQMKIFDSTPATKGGIRALVQWGGYHGNILYDMDGSLTNSSGGRYVHSLKGVRPIPGKQKPTGHFPPKHCSKNPFVDGVACDADQVSMRELQFNCLGAGMYLSTASDQRAPYIPFSQYDAIGRRKYCHVTGVFVKHPNATPVIHEFDWAAGQSRKSPYYRPKSTAHPFSGEIREMRQNEWAIIRFLAWENPWRWYSARYSIRDGILSGDPLNKYNQSTLSYDESKRITRTRNEWLSYASGNGAHTYLPANITRVREAFATVKRVITPGWVDLLVSGDRAHYREHPGLRGRFYDGTRDDLPVCTNYMRIKKCMHAANQGFGMGRRLCGPNTPWCASSARAMTPGKNCFDNRPTPTSDPEPKEFSWCETTDYWTPPAFATDVVIKAGWTVILDNSCLKTNETRHIDVYGSLILKDPGPGKTVTLRAHTIHIAEGMGYLEAGNVNDRITQGDVRVELYGNPYSDARYGYGLENKFVAVFGFLSLVGRDTLHDSHQIHTWATLQQDAQRGSAIIQVEVHLCSAWSVGDTLAVGVASHSGGEEQCAVERVVLQNSSGVNSCNITCKDVFKFDHAGPKIKAGHTFRGVPVTLWNKGSPGGRVGIYGMDDAAGALRTHMHGAVVAILPSRAGSVSRNDARKYWASFSSKARAQEAAKTNSFVPPKECRNKRGSAVIVNAHFSHCGQIDGERPCVSISGHHWDEFNVEKSAEDDSPNGGSPMVIDGTTFSDTYNTAVQVKASGVKIHGNAVTNATNGGFMVSGSANNITDNLVFGIKGKRNMFFDVGNFGYTLSGTGKWHRNIAADVEFTAFRLDGRRCDADYTESLDPNDLPDVYDLRVYHAGVGVTLQAGEKSVVTREPVDAYTPTICRQWSDVEIRGTWHYGVHISSTQLRGAIRIKRAHLWDTGLGMAFWMMNSGSGESGGSSQRGAFVEILDSTIVGSSSRCKNDGIGFPAFYLKTQAFKPARSVGTPSRFGGSSIMNVTFSEFNSCPGGGKNYALVNSMDRARYRMVFYDNANPVRVSGLHFDDSVPDANRLLMVKPLKSRIQGGSVVKYSCSQFYCDGHRNTYVNDLDGSLIGDGKFGSVIPENEIGWFEKLQYVDPLGRETMESLIPITAQWLPNGTKLVPLKGKLYDEPGLLRVGCKDMRNDWQAWVCPEGRHRQIIFESLDKDALERRISPTSVLTEIPSLASERFMSLYTGPPLYKVGWNEKIRRSNTLWVTGHLDATHTVHHSSTTPQLTRVSLVDSTPEEAVHVKLYYGIVNRVDVYVDGKLKTPLKDITWDNPAVPDFSSAGMLASLEHGANFYNRLNGYLEFILRGPGEVQLRISNTVVLSLKVKVTEDKFFEPGLEGLVDNVRLLLNIPAERIAVAGVGDFEEAKSLARSRRNPSLGTHAQTNATTRVVDLVITDVSTTAMPSSPRDTEQISTFQEETIYRNTAADLRRLSGEVIGNASRLTAGTNLSLTEPISIKQEPIEPIPGWTCNSTMYADGSFCDCNCGAWDPDCDLDQPQHRGCPTTLPFSFSDDSCVSANMLRSYCVNASSDISCSVAVPSEDLCPEWPCARDLGQVRGECTASDELLRVIEATQSNKFTCEKASSEDGEVEIGRCSLTLLNNDGVVLSANRTQTSASNTTTQTNVTFTTNATNTQETIEDQNSMDLPVSTEPQASSSVPSSPHPDVPGPVPSSPRPDVPGPVPSSPRPDVPSSLRPVVLSPVPPSPRPDVPTPLSPSSSPSQEAPASPSRSRREVRVLVRTIDRLNSRIASEEAWIESAPRVYREKSEEETKQKNAYKAAVSTLRRLERTVRSQTRRNTRLAARGRPVVDLTQTNEHRQTAASNVSKCKSAWMIARREKKARTTSKIRRAQQNLRALKDRLRRLEGEYAAATSLTPSAGAHLGSARDRYAYSRYISLLYASTFIIGVVALAGVGRRMSSERVAIARRAVPTYGAVDV